MRTVIVTGATGHVGRYVVDELARAGFDVVAAARSGAVPRPPFGAAPVSVRTLPLDVADDAAVAVLADALVPGAAIVHLAGWHPPATAALDGRRSPRAHRDQRPRHPPGARRGPRPRRPGRRRLCLHASRSTEYRPGPAP